MANYVFTSLGSGTFRNTRETGNSKSLDWYQAFKLAVLGYHFDVTSARRSVRKYFLNQNLCETSVDIQLIGIEVKC